jgi:hypothetical protein
VYKLCTKYNLNNGYIVQMKYEKKVAVLKHKKIKKIRHRLDLALCEQHHINYE